MTSLFKRMFIVGEATFAATALVLSFAACGGSDSGKKAAASPTVLSNSPVDGAIDVPLNVSLSAAFSEAMDPSTITSATVVLKQGTTVIAGPVTYATNIMTLIPAVALDASTLYSVSIAVGAKNLAHQGLAAVHEWTFTTGTTVNTTTPTVLSTNPADGAQAVAVNRNIAAVFSAAMNTTTVNAATFTLAGPGTAAVAGAVVCSGSGATFTPNASLVSGTLYHATITTGAKDLAGNALASDFAFSFTTGSSAALGPQPVLLGSAGNFVILAKAGIDTVPASAIVGNIGVSPAAATYITGFSLTADTTNVFATSPQITGKAYAANYAVPTPSNLTTAVSDMETAYTDAAGRLNPDHTELGAGEIGGKTLTPGLYKWGTGVAISTDVTLAGGANDVWIFQIAGDVTQANGTNIALTGGALAKNIFWQTFGTLMIGTTAHFEGIALVQTAIALGTGASVNGRLLAQTAVTLNQNAVTQPAP